MLRNKDEFFDIFNSSSQELKLVITNLTTYKLMVEESLLVLLFKAFTKNKGLRSDILHFIYMMKTV